MMKIKTWKLIATITATALLGSALGVGTYAITKSNNDFGFKGTYNLNAFAATATADAQTKTVAGVEIDTTSVLCLTSDIDNNGTVDYTLFVSIVDNADMSALTNVKVGYSIGDKYYNGTTEGLSNVVYSSLTVNSTEGGTATVTAAELATNYTKITSPMLIITEVEGVAEDAAIEITGTASAEPVKTITIQNADTNSEHKNVGEVKLTADTTMTYAELAACITAPDGMELSAITVDDIDYTSESVGGISVKTTSTITARFEEKDPLSRITVNNVTTFNSDIDYGSENIELDIMLDNGYTFNSAKISVIASDPDYVSVINTDGKYYAQINKITYGTEKSDGVTIEIKSDRFKNVQPVTLNVKVAATAPVIELASEDEISAFAGDDVKLPTITTSKKCDGDIAPTVTVKKGTNIVVDVYDASNNTVTCAETGEDYTVTYTITDDRAASPLTTSKTINVKLYRKVFKAVTGKKVYDYPETVLDFDYGNDAKFVADANQTVSIQESNTVLGQFNMPASKYYYAEATFTLKKPGGDSFVGLSHSLPVDSGTPIRWLAAMVDRGDRNFKIKDIDMTDKTGKESGNPDCFNYNLKDVLYRNRLDDYGGLTDSNAKTVKFAVARADKYFYTFINDQFVMVNTDKDYSEPTVPGIFGIKLSDNEAGVTIGSISWVEGEDATNTKLNELYTDKYFGYHKWDKGPSFDKADNGFTTSNNVGTSEEGANVCYMSSGITPYVVFDGDFKVEYDYTNTKAEYSAVRWTRGALLNVISALSHTDGGQKQVMASVGVRITGDNATSGNNVVYHGSPAMQESGVPFTADDVVLSGSGANQANFINNNYNSTKPYTTLAVHNGDKVHFSVERRLKSDHAEYTMKITVNGNTVTRVMQVSCKGWSDPVMFMWGNQSNHGTVSNIDYQPIQA